MAELLDILALIGLGWYTVMLSMAIAGSSIAFRKYRQPPPPPPFPISASSQPRSQLSASSNPSRSNSKTQNLLIPSVSILRPLCGLDYGLKENLESAFLQQWPLDRFEIIFCLADPLDPARKVAQALIDKYPAVRARLLIGEERVGVNPKINNLMEAYRTAEADLLWILDSNARVHPTTLARSVSVLCPPSGPTRIRRRTRIGLVHHIPAAILPNNSNYNTGLGSLLEACFLNGNHARQYLSLNSLSVASCLMGKSNLFYRSDLEQATRRYLALNKQDHGPQIPNNNNHRRRRVSNNESDEQASLLDNNHQQDHSSYDALELYGQFLAEDNMIGQTLWDDGIRHAMTIDVVGNLVGQLSVKDYFDRRIRWIRARKFMSIGCTLVEPFTESILLGIAMSLSLERLQLINNNHTIFSKKIILFLHESIYFLLDYLVYRSLLHSPLFRSTASSASGSGEGEVTNHQTNPQQSNSSCSQAQESSSTHHPYSPEHTSLWSSEQEEGGAESVEDLIKIKLNFFEFLIGWILRESSALLIWVIAMSSNKVRWRKSGKVLKVLRGARVAESN
ncbi:hypothetical protein MJO28_007570 [Puccinia striiformis f. sp. tritici]|uniref:Ceramide glucosyltransferase n=2 Tax=Puccinia striiformis TaxID=27350 RepID=A0A2S4VV97_9BASI|nr:hypothetical protein MJO28_007570 [Puccinia striiformis f. sp. tritici]POW13428.1 hypothetical protein PSHT_07701 [Puccinia striiformis]